MMRVNVAIAIAAHAIRGVQWCVLHYVFALREYVQELSLLI